MPDQIFGVPALAIVMGLMAVIIAAMGMLKRRCVLTPEQAGLLAFGLGFGLALYYLRAHMALPWDEAAVKAFAWGISIPLVHKVMVKPFTDSPPADDKPVAHG